MPLTHTGRDKSTRGIFQFDNVVGAVSRAVATRPSLLRSIILNKLGGVGATVKVYNSSSATAPDLIGTIDANTSIGTLMYDVEVNKGIFVVTTGAVDITVIYA